jgi:hypothetical protein
MTARTLQHELSPFIGKQLIDSADAIEAIAAKHGFSVNVIDPEFNTGSIDNERDRLNVRTGADSIITSFTIG